MHKADRLCEEHGPEMNLEETNAKTCQYPLYSLMIMREISGLMDTCADLLGTNDYLKTVKMVEIISSAKKKMRKSYNKL